MATVYVSAIINAPIDQVWPYLRGFNRLAEWHPFVSQSRIEDELPEAQVGCVRNFQLVDSGDTIREQLLTLSDQDHRCTYSILDSPMPIEGYLASVQLIEITTTNQTFGHWRANFDVAKSEEQAIVELVTSVFTEGFASLNKILDSSP